MWLGFKLVLGAWAGLNALDEATHLIRIVRLGVVSLPFIESPDSMCDLCDTVSCRRNAPSTG